MFESSQLLWWKRVRLKSSACIPTLHTLLHQLSVSQPIPSFIYPAFFHRMASLSALPTVNKLSEHVSQLLQRSSQTEAETRSITLQCLALRDQIEKTKASVVEERMKQLVCADEIARFKKTAVPRHSGSKLHPRNKVHSSLGLKSGDSLQHGCNSRYPHTSTSLEMREYCRALGKGVAFDPKNIDVCYDDDWRWPRGLLTGFFAHQEERHVF